LGKGKLFLFFEERKNEMCLTVRLDFQLAGNLFIRVTFICLSLLFGGINGSLVIIILKVVKYKFLK